MYNTKKVNAFIEKINEEAEQAAQKIFDKYENDFKNLVESELKKGQSLITSMGTAYFSDIDFDFLTKKQVNFLTQISRTT